MLLKMQQELVRRKSRDCEQATYALTVAVQ
jgi:hypothetical protein